MFDVYMEGQSVDPRTRMRMMMALVASLAVTTAAGSMSWASGRLSIGTVGPPSFTAAELSLHTMVPMIRTDPPPAPKPTTEVAPAAVAARTTSNPRRGEPKTAPDDGAPTEAVSHRLTGSPDGSEDGERGIPGRDSRGCVGVGCVLDAPIGKPPEITVPSKTGTETKKKTRETFAVLKARGIYTPDPRTAVLAKTKTGLGSRRPGVVKVDFCVGPNGKVSSSKVTQRFSGDPEVDRICRAAVQKWRFKPARAGGKARTTCSDVTFRIEFDG